MSEPVSLIRQQARCAFTVMAMGRAILALPDEIPVSLGHKKMKNLCDRVTRWHTKACEEVGGYKLPPLNKQTVVKLIKRFSQKAYPHDFEEKRLFHAAKAFWTSVIFLWDVRVTCPNVARNNTWRYLDKATEELARILLSCTEEAEAAGEDLYLELVW